MSNLRRHAQWLRIVGVLLWLPSMWVFAIWLNAINSAGPLIVVGLLLGCGVTWAFCLVADVLDTMASAASDASQTQENTRIVADGVRRTMAATYDVVPMPSQSKADQSRR